MGHNLEENEISIDEILLGKSDKQIEGETTALIVADKRLGVHPVVSHVYGNRLVVNVSLGTALVEDNLYGFNVGGLCSAVKGNATGIAGGLYSVVKGNTSWYLSLAGVNYCMGSTAKSMLGAVLGNVVKGNVDYAALGAFVFNDVKGNVERAVLGAVSYTHLTLPTIA